MANTVFNKKPIDTVVKSIEFFQTDSRFLKCVIFLHIEDNFVR